jgi:hypothetical protein
MKMARRELLKTAGLGSIALGSLATLADALARPVWADDRVNFRFLSISQAKTIGGVQHRVNISGDGKITAEEVVGGGSFNHFNNASPVPKTLLAFGSWKVKDLISFGLIGKYGALAAGVLEVKIHLIPVGGSVTPATLRVVCNIGAAGLSTGEEEGATLSIPGTPFGPFAPVADSALSIFTTGVEERD